MGCISAKYLRVDLVVIFYFTKQFLACFCHFTAYVLLGQQPPAALLLSVSLSLQEYGATRKALLHPLIRKCVRVFQKIAKGTL